MTNDGKLQSPSHAKATHFGWRLAISYVLICILVVGFAAWHLYDSRQSALQSATATNRNLAKTLQYGIAETFGRIDYGLLVVADEVHKQYAAGKPDDKAIEAFLERQAQRVRGLYGFLIANRDGTLTHGRGVNRGTARSIGEREYFARARDNPDTELLVSEPVLGRLTEKPQIVLARRINCVGGSFCGVVFAPIYLDQFRDRFSNLNVGARGLIVLRDKSSALLARYPALPGDLGEPGSVAISPELKKILAAGRDEASYLANSPTDGIPRIYLYKAFSETPLYVIVGLALDEYLASWRKEATYVAALVALFLVSLGFAFWKVYRSWNQRLVLEEKIRALAFYDSLTGLPNRNLFTDRLRQASTKSARSQSHAALLYVDLDNFKELNDTLGHAEGDRLLELVADRLAASLREGDTVARFGGDEFVVLLEDLGADYGAAAANAMVSANKIRNALNLPYTLLGAASVGWHCSSSIGIAVFVGQSETMDTILDKADKALYQAKKSGKDTICLSQATESDAPVLHLVQGSASR
jgi:diguanylate cyclase (GGDEF)-like protein